MASDIIQIERRFFYAWDYDFELKWGYSTGSTQKMQESRCILQFG